MVKIMADGTRVYTKKELAVYVSQLEDYGYLKSKGKTIGLTQPIGELLLRCEKFGIRLRQPYPDDDVPTLISCYLADLVLREKVLAKPGTKMLKRDFDDLFFAYGRVFFFFLDRYYGADKLRKSWFNYTKKHMRQIPR